MMLAATVERGDAVFVFSHGKQRRSRQGDAHRRGLRRTTLAIAVRDTPLGKAVALVLTIDSTDDGDVLGPTCLCYAFVAVDRSAYGTAIRNRTHAQES
jgi:hypothetical protein